MNERAEQLESLLPGLLRRMFSGVDETLSELTLPQLRILRTLLDGPRTAGEVSDLLGFSASGLSQLTQRLVSAGLLAKTKDDHDARVKHLALTKRGRTLMEQRRSTRVVQAEMVLARLGENEQEEFIRLLEKMSSAAAKESWTTSLERITA